MTGGLARPAWRIAPDTSFSRRGGYNFGAGNTPTPFQAYTTSLDIYLLEHRPNRRIPLQMPMPATDNRS
jgi:hypothetical protein